MPGESKRKSSKKKRRRQKISTVPLKAFLDELKKKIVKNNVSYDEMVKINSCFNNCIRKRKFSLNSISENNLPRESVVDGILSRYTGNEQQKQKISDAFDTKNPNSHISIAIREHIMSQYTKSKGTGKSKKKSKKKRKKKQKKGKKSKKGGKRLRKTKRKSRK